MNGCLRSFHFFYYNEKKERKDNTDYSSHIDDEDDDRDSFFLNFDILFFLTDTVNLKN